MWNRQPDTNSPERHHCSSAVVTLHQRQSESPSYEWSKYYTARCVCVPLRLCRAIDSVALIVITFNTLRCWRVPLSLSTLFGRPGWFYLVHECTDVPTPKLLTKLQPQEKRTTILITALLLAHFLCFLVGVQWNVFWLMCHC